MKIFGVVTMAAAAMATAYAGTRAPKRERSVTVCISPGSDRYLVHAAEALTAGIFAEIRVRIDWRDRGRCPAGDRVIEVNLLYRSAETAYSNAWAYAQPHKRQIVVFYDRIRQSGPDRVECFLAYLLAHEIAHVLQGTGGHSESGVMKARWNRGDYVDMIRGHLSFSGEDVTLIYRGLDGQQSSPAGAAPVAAQ